MDLPALLQTSDNNYRIKNVPPLVQQAYDAWKNYTHRRIDADLGPEFAKIEAMSQLLTNMTDILCVAPANNALKHIVMDIAQHHDKITSIDREMFVARGGPAALHTTIFKNYNIKSNLCFGDMDIHAEYNYTPNEVKLFRMDADCTKEVLDERDNFHYWPGDEDGSKMRTEQKVLLIMLPEMFDLLYDARTGIKTPGWSDFVAADLDRHYTNMKKYCAQILNRWFKGKIL